MDNDLTLNWGIIKRWLYIRIKKYGVVRYYCYHHNLYPGEEGFINHVFGP